jgi:RNA polymerase sigma-70 factor (ECF subfamily)
MPDSSVATTEIVRIVDQAVAGDERAIWELVERYRDRIFRFCFRMLGQRQDAEDMTQESLTRLVGSLDRWDRGRPFEPWIFTIAANRCRTFLALRGRRSATLPLSPFEESNSRWAEQDAARQLAEEVERAMENLRLEYRRAFQLFHQRQYSYEELGKVLQVPPGTAKTWVHRARKQLIEVLKRRGVVE